MTESEKTNHTIELQLADAALQHRVPRRVIHRGDSRNE